MPKGISGLFLLFLYLLIPYFYELEILGRASRAGMVHTNTIPLAPRGRDLEYFPDYTSAPQACIAEHMAMAEGADYLS